MISARDLPQTYVLDRAATGTGTMTQIKHKNREETQKQNTKQTKKKYVGKHSKKLLGQNP